MASTRNYWSLIAQIVPATSWIPELKKPKIVSTEFIAGLTVALVLIPQSMAYAQLAGLPAYYGLYAAFLPPIVAAIFGSSRQLATGPVAIVSIMTASALEPLATAGSEGYIAYAIVLAILVGTFELMLGLLKMGAFINFLAHPVILGFTNAAAIIIASSQLDKIFGVKAEKGEHYYETVANSVVAISQNTHWPTLAIAAMAFAIMYVLKKINPRIPGVLIAVASTTFLAWLIEFEKIREIRAVQLVSTDAQHMLFNRIANQEIVIRLGTEIVEANAKFKEIQKLRGNIHPDTLEAKHDVENLRLYREQLYMKIKTTLKEFQKLRFVEVMESESGNSRFYLRDRVPADAVTDGRVWKLREITEDKKLIMSAGGQVVGKIPSGLPSLTLPKFDGNVFGQLVAAAITIALMGFMEAISIAKAMATRTRQRLDPNQELIGQGLANIVGGLFLSYPTSGSFSRSAVNLSAGATTGLSSVVTGLIVVAVLLWFTPLLYHLPQATLAAVIMIAVVGLINFGAFKHSWRAQPHDGVVAIVSFVLTLAMAPHLEYGILVGAGLALGLYLYRTMKPRVAPLGLHSDGTLRDSRSYDVAQCDQISLIRFDGSLYFANGGYFQEKILQNVADRPKLKYIIMDGPGINQIDSTGEEILRSLVWQLRQSGIEMFFSRIKKPNMEVLQRTGFLDTIGEDHFFRKTEDALEHVWGLIGRNHKDKCPLNPQAQKG